jgi:hypothetical protein
MKRSRVVLLLLVAAVLVLFILPTSVALAQAQVYDDDWQGWQAAARTWNTEDFSDRFLNPGVSVDTSRGELYTFGRLRDLLLPGYSTTWYFSTPMRAWGGWWDPYGLSGPDWGMDVWVYLGRSWEYVGHISEYYQNNFWGFVSSTPFTAVRLTGEEGYYFDNMVYSAFTQYYPGFIGKGGWGWMWSPPRGSTVLREPA